MQEIKLIFDSNASRKLKNPGHFLVKTTRVSDSEKQWIKGLLPSIDLSQVDLYNQLLNSPDILQLARIRRFTYLFGTLRYVSLHTAIDHFHSSIRWRGWTI